MDSFTRALLFAEFHWHTHYECSSYYLLVHVRTASLTPIFRLHLHAGTHKGWPCIQEVTKLYLHTAYYCVMSYNQK